MKKQKHTINVRTYVYNVYYDYTWMIRRITVLKAGVKEEECRPDVPQGALRTDLCFEMQCMCCA